MTTPSRRRGAVGGALVALVAPLALTTPAWASTTANEVVYTADDDNDGAYTLVLRDLESRRVTTVLPELFLPTATGRQVAVIYDDPELSPDGSRIVLSTDRGSDTRNEGLALVNRDGSGFVRVTQPPPDSRSADGTTVTSSLDVAPTWSPSGDRIAFTRITVTGTADSDVDCEDDPRCTIDTAIFTVTPTAGATPAALAGAEDGYTADWSPDGSKIVFAAMANPTTDDNGALTVVPSSGGSRTALGPQGVLPAWSPDGALIAYSTVTARDADRQKANDTTQIAVVASGGGTEQRFAVTQPSSAPTVAEYPAWSPDGESILFDLYGYSDTDAFPPGDLWAVDRFGARAGRVVSTPGDDAQPDVHGPRPSPVSPGQASTYRAVTPTRILDTRSGVGAPTGKVGPGSTVELAVRGVQTAQGTVPANASAVVLNVTVTGTTATTDVRAYPSGTPVPGASNINAGAGQTVPNLVTVRIGDNGGITLRNSAGSVNLLADIAGYYTPDTAGAGFAALDPSRILDTRSPSVGAPAGKVGPEGVVPLKVTGSIPTADQTTVTVPGDATAVVLNVTATGATSTTDVRVYPASGGAVPETSNLNVRAGQTTPNLVTVAVGEGGVVNLRNAAGSVNLIADLAGYYAPSAPGRFVPVAPTRFLDTRSGIGGAPIPVTGEGHVDLKVAGARGVPAGATAAVLNLTGTGVTTTTDVRAYPVGAARVPTVSNLNLAKGSTRANLAIVKTGTDGRVRVRNGAGSVNLIGDLAGYMIG
jgi:Tol biopolymer transport system component